MSPVEPTALDYLALAEQLIADGNLAGRHILINEHLLDVNTWRALDVSEVAHRLAEDPLATLAAWELTSARERLDTETRNESEYLRLFSHRDFLKRMIYIGISRPPETLELPRATVRIGQDKWDALLFLHDVIRWASRFAHVRPYDRREFLRINLNHPFAVAVFDKETGMEQTVMRRAFDHMGIPCLTIPPDLAQHHLAGWLAEQLGLEKALKRAKQRTLDFREAGRTRNSFFVVRAMGGVDGYDVRGSVGEDLGLIIDIGDREVSKAATAYMEHQVVRIINDHTELSATLNDDAMELRWYDSRLTASDLGKIIYEAVKCQFTLGVLSVNVIFDPLRIGSLRASVYSYREERETELKRRTEENEPFVVCTSCRSYSPHAFCVASVDRPPCCGRKYDELAALARFTNGLKQFTLNQGICQDRLRGCYMGVDKAARLYSEEEIKAVSMHSIRDYPHPTTAIPECIAWYMDEFDVIAIISRDFAGRSPDGKTFDSLLSRVAGMQSAGYVGISEEYITSPKFFQAEGGISRVAWMNSVLMERTGIRNEHIATETDCNNMASLRDHLATWSH